MQFWGPLLPVAIIQQATGDITINVTSGDVVFTGQTVTLNVSIPLTEAALIFSGQSVGLSLSVGVTEGSLILTGQPVSFAVSVPLTQGQLTFAGQDVELQFNYILSVNTGELSFVGQGVDIVITAGNVAPSRGGYKKQKPKVWKNEREAIRKALKRAIDGPEQEEFELVLAPYIKPQAPGSIFDKIDWNQVGIEAVAIEARLNAIVQEYEDEELMLLL